MATTTPLHTEKKPALVLLTLQRHEKGVWITRLVEALRPLAGASPDRKFDVQVLSLESLLTEPFFVTNTKRGIQSTNNRLEHHHYDWVGLINRVSDAADPVLYKACLAVLHACSVQGIPVWNGPASYGMCGNKWCHHVLFQRAGLASPEPTVALFRPTLERIRGELMMERTKTALPPPTTTTKPLASAESVLIKPNAGGFGAGMIRLKPSELLDTSVPSYADEMALLQPYLQPRENRLYRVWFLRGKVQCGLVRQLPDEGVEDELTSGCSAGVCSRPVVSVAAGSGTEPPLERSMVKLMAFCVPQEVRSEIENNLLPLLTDCHSGSVEYLENANRERLYFDLNLLSTLPLPETPMQSTSAWGPYYDPWNELTTAIVDFIMEDST